VGSCCMLLAAVPIDNGLIPTYECAHARDRCDTLGIKDQRHGWVMWCTHTADPRSPMFVSLKRARAPQSLRPQATSRGGTNGSDHLCTL